MIDGIPNRPLYFYQKDIIDSEYNVEWWKLLGEPSCRWNMHSDCFQTHVAVFFIVYNILCGLSRIQSLMTHVVLRKTWILSPKRLPFWDNYQLLLCLFALLGALKVNVYCWFYLYSIPLIAPFRMLSFIKFHPNFSVSLIYPLEMRFPHVFPWYFIVPTRVPQVLPFSGPSALSCAPPRYTALVTGEALVSFYLVPP